MMNEKILNCLGNISDRYITEAYSYKKTPIARRVVSLLAAGALAAVTVFVCAKLIPVSDPYSELPMLTIGEASYGMGFEGYMAYDISDLASGNPWNEESTPDSMPVYKNSLSVNAYGMPWREGTEKMEATLISVAERLSMDIDSLVITDDAPPPEAREGIAARYDGNVPDGLFEATRVMVEDDKYKIEVDTSLTAAVRLKEPFMLPESCAFGETVTYDDAYNAAEYLLVEFSALIGMDDPKISIGMGDYDIYGKQNFTIEFYEGSDDPVSAILNYNFANVSFGGTHDNEISIVRINAVDLSEKVGDYPIISVSEAHELLIDGAYVTSVPYVMPGKEYIKKAELIYRTAPYEEYYMPYYRFYVELPDEKRGDMNTYGAYYVPAVKGEYIRDMPIYDGRFN